MRGGPELGCGVGIVSAGVRLQLLGRVSFGGAFVGALVRFSGVFEFLRGKFLFEYIG